MSIRLTAILLTISVLTFSPSATAEPPISVEKLEAELRATEVAFARTMETRDHKAFVSFLMDESVFFGAKGAIRGRDAVAAAWKPLFETETAPFSWAPEEVVVNDSGILGFSTGPVVASDGSSLGSFNSVWQRQADGTWKIVFDKGCQPCTDKP